MYVYPAPKSKSLGAAAWSLANKNVFNCLLNWQRLSDRVIFYTLFPHAVATDRLLLMAPESITQEMWHLAADTRRFSPTH